MKAFYPPFNFSGRSMAAWLFVTGLMLFCLHPVFGQGPTSSIGSRTNLGIYGGPVKDISFSYADARIFATSDGPGTVFYSDNLGINWFPAFPFDSLENRFFPRGWGGGSERVLTNIRGWVAVKTNYEEKGLSAAVISYLNGASGSFLTGFDPFLLEGITGEFHTVTAIALSGHYLYTGLGSFLTRVNDTTTIGPYRIVINMKGVSGAGPDPSIVSIATSNSASGYPVYMAVETFPGSNDTRLWKHTGAGVIQLTALPPDLNVVKVFTHPGQINGDTCIISGYNNLLGQIQILKTMNGGATWTNITPAGGTTIHLSDADYSPDWVPFMPLSNGLRLSFPGGKVSDNLGLTWTTTVLPAYSIATHPQNLAIVTGSDHIGFLVSYTGLGGQFSNPLNEGFEGVTVNKISKSQGRYYFATNQGLGYTNAIGFPGSSKWQPPYGQFPIPNVSNINGITAVAINPSDTDHVVAGSSAGFHVTTSGPNGFINVTPSAWNNNMHQDPYVSDIKFVTPNILLAVTGYKHTDITIPPANPVGNIWRSVNGGYTWYLVTPLMPDVFVNGLSLEVAFDGFNTVVYAGSGYNRGGIPDISGAIWRSNDFGDTWVKINDGPVKGSPVPLPVYDIAVQEMTNDILYIAADKTVARSANGGYTYFLTNIPYSGSHTTVMIDPIYPDSVTVSSGNCIYKYNFLIDDADLKFKGYPEEFVLDLQYGSTYEGTNTSASKLVEAKRYYLDLTEFIEGPYNGTDLNTSLNNNGYLPLSQPFNVPPWNYNGTESVAAIPNSDVVDWVLIELRESAGGGAGAIFSTQFERQAGFLMKDGSILSTDGSNNMRFNYIIEDDLWGIIYHPNHIPVMTGSAIVVNAETYGFDFTTGAAQVYGGSLGHKQIGTGVWGMVSGDGDGDGNITNADKIDIWRPQVGLSGYYGGDFNRDGQVNNDDKVSYWRPNAGYGTQVP